MKGIILAAGRGSRLGELGANRPKCLVELAGRTLLEWQLASLAEAGIVDVAVVGGYCREQLPQVGVKTFTNPRWAETGIVASLLCAREWLEREPCLVSYADIVFDADIIRRLAALSGDVAITSYRYWRPLWELRFSDPLQDAESFRTDPTGRLVEIGARADSLDDIQGQYMGLLKFTPEGFARVESVLDRDDVRDRLDMTSLLSRLLATNVPVQTESVGGLWYEVDSAADAKLFVRWQQELGRLTS